MQLQLQRRQTDRLWWKTTVRIGEFQMVMCIPLICISDRRELVQIYQREHVQQMTHVIFCKLLYGGFVLGESVTVFSRFLLDHIIS